MTFEKEFILKCFDCIEKILSNDEELNEAIRQFTENKVTNRRYHLNSKITDSINWSDQDKLSLSAAIFEAIARASISFYAENTKRVLEINSAGTTFLEKYVPKITEKTNSENRLDSVRQNIAHIKEEDFKSAAEKRAENPYTFFTPVSAGLVVLAATAATAALLSYKA